MPPTDTPTLDASIPVETQDVADHTIENSEELAGHSALNDAASHIELVLKGFAEIVARIRGLDLDLSEAIDIAEEAGSMELFLEEHEDRERQAAATRQALNRMYIFIGRMHAEARTANPGCKKFRWDDNIHRVVPSSGSPANSVVAPAMSIPGSTTTLSERHVGLLIYRMNEFIRDALEDFGVEITIPDVFCLARKKQLVADLGSDDSDGDYQSLPQLARSALRQELFVQRAEYRKRGYEFDRFGWERDGIVGVGNSQPPIARDDDDPMAQFTDEQRNNILQETRCLAAIAEMDGFEIDEPDVLTLLVDRVPVWDLVQRRLFCVTPPGRFMTRQIQDMCTEAKKRLGNYTRYRWSNGVVVADGEIIPEDGILSDSAYASQFGWKAMRRLRARLWYFVKNRLNELRVDMDVDGAFQIAMVERIAHLIAVNVDGNPDGDDRSLRDEKSRGYDQLKASVKRRLRQAERRSGYASRWYWDNNDWSIHPVIDYSAVHPLMEG